MNQFKDILKGIKFSDDIDYDKIVSVQITREELRDGYRLYASANYDTGKRFESYGELNKPAQPVATAAPEGIGSEPEARAPKIEAKPKTHRA